MQFNNIDISKSENDIHCHLSMTSDDLDEIKELQHLILDYNSLQVIPEELFLFLLKFNNEIKTFFIGNHPEEMLSKDMQQALKFLKDLYENKNDNRFAII